MDFLTTSEVARLLCLSEAGVRKWEKEGMLKAFRTARNRRLFKREDVEKLIPKEAVTP